MTAFELCGEYKDEKFTVGNGKVIWESAVYRGVRCDKVRITRVVQSNEGGKGFLMGLNFKQRYIDPKTEIHIIND